MGPYTVYSGLEPKDVEHLGGYVSDAKHPEAHASVRRDLLRGDLPWDLCTKEHYWSTVAARIRAGLIRDLRALGVDVRRERKEALLYWVTKGPLPEHQRWGQSIWMPIPYGSNTWRYIHDQLLRDFVRRAHDLLGDEFDKYHDPNDYEAVMVWLDYLAELGLPERDIVFIANYMRFYALLD